MGVDRAGKVPSFDEDAFAEATCLASETWDDYEATVKETLAALRALPVEQRMEAMGMTKRTMHVAYEAHHLCNDGCREAWTDE